MPQTFVHIIRINIDSIFKNIIPHISSTVSLKGNTGYMFLTHRGVYDQHSVFCGNHTAYVWLVGNGSIHMVISGMTRHARTTAKITSLDYVFNLQIDQSIGGESNPTYYRFGKPYSELTSKYEPYIYNI